MDEAPSPTYHPDGHSSDNESDDDEESTCSDDPIENYPRPETRLPDELHCGPPTQAKQSATLDTIMKGSLEMVHQCIEERSIFNHKGDFSDEIVMKNFWGKNKSVVYRVPSTGKIGMSLNAEGRFQHYAQETESPIVLVDLDDISPKLDKTLQVSLRKILKSISPEKLPKKLSQFETSDISHATVYLLSLAANVENVPRLWGFSRRFLGLFMETGLQCFHNVHRASSSKHEAVSAPDMLDKYSNFVNEGAYRIYGLLTDKEQQIYREKLSATNIRSQSSWPPNLPNYPKEMVLTRILAECMSGSKHFQNSFDKPAKPDGTTSEDIWSSDYPPEDIDRAYQSLLKSLVFIEGDFGLLFLDRNKVIFDHLDSTPEILLTERGWDLLDSFLNLKVYILRKGANDPPKLIILIGPLCMIADSSTNQIPMDKMRQRALEAECAKRFRQLLMKGSFDDDSVHGSILLLSLVYELCVVFLHLSKIIATLIAKSVVSDLRYQVFEPKYNRLLTKGFSNAIAKNLRAYDKRESDRTGPRQLRDCQLRKTLTCMLSFATKATIDNVLEDFCAALRTGKEGTPVRPKTLRERALSALTPDFNFTGALHKKIKEYCFGRVLWFRKSTTVKSDDVIAMLTEKELMFWIRASKESKDSAHAAAPEIGELAVSVVRPSGQGKPSGQNTIWQFGKNPEIIIDCLKFSGAVEKTQGESRKVKNNAKRKTTTESTQKLDFSDYTIRKMGMKAGPYILCKFVHESSLNTPVRIEFSEEEERAVIAGYMKFEQTNKENKKIDWVQILNHYWVFNDPDAPIKRKSANIEVSKLLVYILLFYFHLYFVLTLYLMPLFLHICCRIRRTSFALW